MDGHLCGKTVLGKEPATVGCPVVEAVAVISGNHGQGGRRRYFADTDGRADDSGR